MKVLFSLLLLVGLQLCAEDLNSVEKKLSAQLQQINERLNKQRQQTFQEREKIRREISSTERMYSESESSTKSDQQTLDKLISEVESLEQEVLHDEKLIMATNKSVIQIRRELQTLVPKETAIIYEPLFNQFDQSIEKLTALKKTSNQLISAGFGFRINKSDGLNSQGVKTSGRLLSLSHAIHYLAIGSEGGLAITTPEHNIASIKPIDGIVAAIDSLEKNESTILPFDFTQGLAFEKAAQKKGFFEHFKAGGIIIYPLAFLALICLITGIYKTLQLYLIHSTYDKKVNELVKLIKSGDLEAASSYVNALKDPIRSLLSEALEHHKQSRESLEELLNENILSQLPKLDRLLPILSVTAGAAPLLGLLGTVMGIIKTFEMISIYGTGEANRMAGGISEALVTTEAGLLVAIPALIWYAILNRRLKGIVGNLEKAMLGFINLISLGEDSNESTE